jgi:ABC-type Mn2+/Zn2+ transport system permease subunit
MTIELDALALSVGAGAAAGLVGCFAAMRRMTLAADALSHVALPGIGLAIVLHLHPILGAAVMLLLGTVLVWGVENKTRIATETVIGVVFSFALALGSMITSGEALIEALFGGTRGVTATEAGLGLVVAGFIAWFVLRERHKLILALVSPEIARTAGVNVSRLDLRFLLVFALTIALGLRYLGVLLMGSLVIVPAATAKRLARSMNEMLLVSTGVAVLSTTAGIYAASALHREAGPLIVVVAASFFFLSLLRRRTV